jgi:hypothetical protein
MAKFSVIQLDGRKFHFTSAATMRKLLEEGLLLKEINDEKDKGKEKRR